MVSERDTKTLQDLKDIKTEIENFITFYVGSNERDRGRMKHVLDIYMKEAFTPSY